MVQLHMHKTEPYAFPQIPFLNIYEADIT